MLRAINSSLSAYLSVTYNAGFFDSYDVLDCNVVQAGLLMKVGAAAAAPAGVAAGAGLACRRNATGCRPWVVQRQRRAILCLQQPHREASMQAPTPCARVCPCTLQHVLSVFRTQRVARILFDLSTADCRATVTLHCENGGCRGQGSPARLCCAGQCSR